MRKKAPPWTPGKSGNPAGRPKGIVDRRTALREAIAGELPAIARVLVEKAKDGDVQAASLIMSSCMPKLRPSREPIELAGLPQEATAVEVASALIRGAVQGRLPVDAASELIAAMASAAKILEVEQLSQRIAALENRNVS
jgi:hypothetical protein